MKRTLIAAAIASLSSAAFAQAPAAPSGEWNGSVSLGASYAQSYANVKNTNFALAADANKTTTQDKIALYATTVYGKTSVIDARGNRIGAENANNFKLGGRYEWNLSPQAYAFGSLDLERDHVIGLDLRSALGLGGGYYFVKSDPLTFTAFGGIGVRRDKFEGGSNNYTELLIGEESNHKLNDNMSFKQRLVLYPNMTETGELRAVFDATLSVKLAGAWNMNLTLSDRYDSLVNGQYARKHDTLFLVGVGAKFGK